MNPTIKSQKSVIHFIGFGEADFASVQAARKGLTLICSPGFALFCSETFHISSTNG